MGYSNPKSVANRICALKKKLGIEMCVSLSGANKAGAASNSTAASGPIDATKVRKPPTPKKQPTTPRKPRAKSVNKKSAAEPSQYGAASHTNNASAGEPGVEGGPRMKTDESEEDETEVA
ncbi:MAG: hypothetical protein M1825_005547 [Sarcosagium campestre]|nr:MAG: hypothetical protein M1825_005547 [Sarcosagium campestre]